MPHAVETMFYVRKVPWHGLGTRVDSAPHSANALKLAGLDWTVEQKLVYVDKQVVPGYRANVRSTDSQVLGIVKERYQVLQNQDAFAFADGLLGSGVTYETAGALFGGRRVWLQARLPRPIKLLRDEILPYLCITNSHDGEGAIRVIVTPVRVVCQNTLNFALKNAPRHWSMRHTGNLLDKVRFAEEALELNQNYIGALQARSNVLSQIKVSAKQWRETVERLYPLPENAKMPQYEFYLRLAQERQGLLLDLFWSEDLKPYRETAWAAVNALIDFADHTIRPDLGMQAEENRFARVLDDGQPLVTKALGLLGIPA
jgi:phage/plasmid-like protein (TIGR03299 family)